MSMSRCRRPALAYGLLTLLAACCTVHAQSSPPYIATKAHRNVCVSPFITVDECSGNGTASTFTGLEVQVSRAQSGSRAPSLLRLLDPMRSSDPIAFSPQTACH